MKKAYVKPVMESEAFVANEYVAACWRVACTDCDEKMIYYGDPNWEINDGDPFVENGGIKMYTQAINGVDPEEHTNPISDSFLAWLAWILFGWGEKSYYHTVDVTPGANGGVADLNPSHPNASA